jgi:hypothetical protein
VQQLLQWKINITYSGCVFVALDIHHAMRMLHIAISDLSRYTLFFHILVNGMIFEKKIIEHKLWVLIVSTTFV